MELKYQKLICADRTTRATHNIIQTITKLFYIRPNLKGNSDGSIFTTWK